MTNTSNTNSTGLHHNVIPSEVGWQFVPQYYTFVNKQPNRLHCFYTKTSTFIHGTEGEDGKPCYGQQEIHNKITSIGFEDCKVFIHSVDAQSSANGGIIIQVIGEMSNHGDPWRKFVQTFFLAEQPNGYFVLNDIFRFLKEETVEGDDVSEPEPEPAPATPAAQVPAPEPLLEPIPQPAPAPSAPEPTAVVPTPPPVEDLLTTVIPEPIVPTPAAEPIPQKVNGIHAAIPDLKPESPVPSVEPRVPTPEPAVTTPAPTPAPTNVILPPAPASVPSQAPPPPAAAAPPPQPAAPPAPKTWANLAAANSKKWGAAVAQESRGTTEVPVSPPASATGNQSPAAHHTHLPNNNTQGRSGSGGRDGGVHPAVQAALSVTTAQCFVKGVTEPITQTQLTAVLTQRFGPIKDQAEIVRSKACAFLEFQSLDAAKRAIIACLPVGQGGEGGVRIDVGGEVGSIRILVETRKERGDRPVSRPRGGAPVNGGGDARGAFRGRGGAGSGGTGRGRPPNSK